MAKDKKYQAKMNKIEKYKNLRNVHILQTVNEMRQKEEEKKKILKTNQKDLKKKEKKKRKEIEQKHSTIQWSLCSSQPNNQLKTDVKPSRITGLDKSEQSLTNTKIKSPRKNDEGELKAERNENAKLSKKKIEMNIKKKERKEEYKRQLLEQKIELLNNKARKLKEYQAIVTQERFYANLSNRMKVYHVQEAMNNMVMTKNWNMEKIDEIIEAYRPRLSSAKSTSDMQALQKKINKTLNPYDFNKTLKSLSNNSQY